MKVATDKTSEGDLEQGASKEMSDAELYALLDVPYCFCQLCKHNPTYGYCAQCRCHNHKVKEGE